MGVFKSGVLYEEKKLPVFSQRAVLIPLNSARHGADAEGEEQPLPAAELRGSPDSRGRRAWLLLWTW